MATEHPENRFQLESTFESFDDSAEWHEVLAAGDLPIIEHPAFERYCRLFYDFCPKTPFHIKRSYHHGFLSQKRNYKNKSGEYYRRCSKYHIARHLHTLDRKPYWVGMRFGRKTAIKCLDLDNKQNVLGYFDKYGMSTPIARISLERIQQLKRVYDLFPRHIWCVSSATLGLHIWEKYHIPISHFEIERKNRFHLKQIGLGQTEVYPSPQLRHQILRRPFGLDYYTITEDNILSDWIDQLDYFEAAKSTPPFHRIVEGLFDLARSGWEAVRRGAEFRAKFDGPFAAKRSLHRDLLEKEAEAATEWIRAGCPEVDPGCSPSQVNVFCDKPKPKALKFNLRHNSAVATAEAGVFKEKWSWKKVVELARFGVPEEHRLFEFLLLLARPLIWRDYYHLPIPERAQKAQDDLLFWVLNKHNGLVTRVQLGNIENIEHEIRRQVSVAINQTSVSLQQYYAEMRSRDERYPLSVVRITDVIRSYSSTLIADRFSETNGRLTATSEGDLSSALTSRVEEHTIPSPSLVCCTVIIKELDQLPLPEEIKQRIDQIIKSKKMRIRDNEYPLMRFSKRLLNILWKEDGCAQIHNQILMQYAETKNPNQLLAYKRLLAEHGLIMKHWESYARPGASSSIYQMTTEIFEHFQKHHRTNKTMKRVSLRFIITAEVDAKLAKMEFPWE